MRQIIRFVILIAGLSVALEAQAQNIAAPDDKSNSITSSIFNFFMPKPSSPPASDTTQSAPSPAPAQTTTNHSTTPALSTPVPQQSSDATTAALAGIYLSTQEQNRYIQNEQDTIASLQKALTAIHQADSNAVANIQSVQDKTYANMMRNSMTQIQASELSTVNDLNNQIATSQKRLAILQAGPLKMSDFAKLYGRGS